MDPIIDAKEHIVTAAALLGAFLGVANWLRANSEDKLKVSVHFGTSYDGGSPQITVLNMSKYDVSINEVGYIDDGVKIIGGLDFTLNRALPLRLASRSSASIELHTPVSIVKNTIAYAITANGIQFCSKNPISIWNRFGANKRQ
jgi:hypothetical protein